MSDNLHNVRVRPPFTRSNKTWRTVGLRLELASKREAETLACAVCGKPALYRVYRVEGINIGACKVHVAAVKAKTPLFRGV